MRIYKKTAKWVDLICSSCRKPFKRRESEYRKQAKAGYSVYCSVKCSYVGDGLCVFRDYARQIKRNCQQRIRNGVTHKKNTQFELTPEYLKELWEKQCGICPYTGIKMDLIPEKSKRRVLNAASLDRINPKIGYVHGNVEWVCVFINWGKNTYSKEEVKDFVEQIKKNLNIVAK